MSITEPPVPIKYRNKRIYTFNEAIDLMKALDQFPTGTQINWISIDTGKPVVIGYNE
jgi:hypothetical protein